MAPINVFGAASQASMASKRKVLGPVGANFQLRLALEQRRKEREQRDTFKPCNPAEDKGVNTYIKSGQAAEDLLDDVVAKSAWSRRPPVYGPRGGLKKQPKRAPKSVWDKCPGIKKNDKDAIWRKVAYVSTIKNEEARKAEALAAQAAANEAAREAKQAAFLAQRKKDQADYSAANRAVYNSLFNPSKL